jgi:hypothetical protein
MNGKPLQKIISAPSLSGTVPVAIEYLILFSVGIISILLHARLRTPLNLPGHHGLEFMAILMAGRVTSRIKWASSISSLGIGFILLFPAFGFKDPFAGINYMFPGIVIDIIYFLTRQFKWQMLILALISGFAYFTIPFNRLLIHLISGYPYEAFNKHGYLIPLAGFFIFGMAGGFTGAGITSYLLKRFNKK